MKSVGMRRKKKNIFTTPGFSLKAYPGCATEIMLDDHGSGYFEHHKKEEGEDSELWDDEYYYL